MPDPSTHADDMKSPGEYTPPTIKDALPPMWWFCPWPVVTALADTVDHLKSTSRGEQAARISANQDANRWFMEARRLKGEIEEAKAAIGSHALHDGMTLNACGIKLVPSIERLVEAHKTASDWNKELTAVQVEETKKRVELRDEVDALARKLGEARAERDTANSYVESIRKHVPIVILMEVASKTAAEKGLLVQLAVDELQKRYAIACKASDDLAEAKAGLDEAEIKFRKMYDDVRQATPCSFIDGYGPAGWMRNIVKELAATDDKLAEANSAATEYRRQLDAVTSARDQAVAAVAELNDKLHREQVDHAATLGYVKMAEASLKRWKALAKARGNRLPAKKKKGVSK